MKVDVDFAGLRELERELDVLSKAESRQVLRRAARAGAAVIQREVRSRARRRTGKLARNIAVANGEAAQTRVSAGVVIREEGKADNRRNAFYWRFLEFGWKHFAASPFIRPAFDDRQDQAAAAAQAELLVAIDRVLAR